MNRYTLIAGVNGTGKQAILEINDCLQKNLSFTQETVLSGKRIEKTLIQARKQGYFVSLFYVGLNSQEESLSRILPYCDQVAFYDNENGFIKVAHIQNHRFSFLNGYRPPWILELQQNLSL